MGRISTVSITAMLVSPPRAIFQEVVALMLCKVTLGTEFPGHSVARLAATQSRPPIVGSRQFNFLNFASARVASSNSSKVCNASIETDLVELQTKIAPTTLPSTLETISRIRDSLIRS